MQFLAVFVQTLSLLAGGAWRHNLRACNAVVVPHPDELPRDPKNVDFHNTGYSSSPQNVKMVVANLVSIRKHLDKLLALQADVMLISEVQLASNMIAPLCLNLKKRGVEAVIAVPHHNQSQANVGKFGGVAVLTRQPIAPIELSEAEYGSLWCWRQAGRVCAVKLVDHSATCIGIAMAVYWRVDWQLSRASFDEATQFWHAIQDFHIAWSAYPLWVGGDMNTVPGEHYAFDALTHVAGLTDVLLAHCGERVPTTNRQAGPIDHLLANQLAASMTTRAHTAHALVFPDHLHLSAEIHYPQTAEYEVIDMPRPLVIPKDFKAGPVLSADHDEFSSAIHQHDFMRALLVWSHRWETWIVSSLQSMGCVVKPCQRGRGMPRAWQPVMRTRHVSPQAGKDSGKAVALVNLMEQVAVRIREAEAGQLVEWNSLLPQLRQQNLADHNPGEGKDPYELYSLLEGDLLAEQDRARKLRLASWKAKLHPEQDIHLAAACAFVADRSVGALTSVRTVTEHGVQTLVDTYEMDNCLIDTWQRMSCPSHGTVRSCTQAQIQMARAWIPEQPPTLIPHITSRHLCSARRDMKINGPTGWGAWATSMIRCLPELALQELARMLNACEAACQLPVGLTSPLVTMIPKKEAPLASDFRPIAVLSSIMRWYSRARMIPIREALEQQLAPQQYGARPGRDTSIPVARIQCRLQQARNGGHQLFGAQTDLAKYFDNVSVEAATFIMQRIGIDSPYTNLTCKEYSSMAKRFKFANGKVGRPWQSERGVPQGDSYSVALANAAMITVCAMMEEVNKQYEGEMMVFVDDIVLLSSTSQGLTKMLECADKFFHGAGFSVNISKSCAFATHGTEVFKLHDAPLPSASIIHYLGHDIVINPSERPVHCQRKCPDFDDWDKIEAPLAKLANLPGSDEHRARVAASAILPRITYAPHPPQDRRVAATWRRAVYGAIAPRLSRCTFRAYEVPMLYFQTHRVDPIASQYYAEIRFLRAIMGQNQGLHGSSRFTPPGYPIIQVQAIG